LKYNVSLYRRERRQEVGGGGRHMFLRKNFGVVTWNLCVEGRWDQTKSFPVGGVWMFSGAIQY